MIHSFRLFIAFTFLGVIATLSAQPNWTVNPADFQYTMTVTGAAFFGCEESMDENDMVAAFINNEVRGVQLFDTEFQGRQYAFLIVYDNDLNGNEITFKLYDHSEDQVFDVLHTTLFAENGNVGGVGDPFEFNTELLIDSLFLSSDTISADATVGEVVAEIMAINEGLDTLSLTYSFVNDALGVDNAYFSLNGNQLILETNADTKDSYQIHVVGVDSNGCSLDVVFVLTVPNGGVSGIFDGTESSRIAIQLFPNPANQLVYLETVEKIDCIRIYNRLGQIVLSFELPPLQPSIDVSNLPEEIYWVVLQSNGFVQTKKLMVKH